MAMDNKLLQALQSQINAEMYSSYLYLSMSSWAERQNLKGFANWFRIQAKEELFHATFMHDYLIRRGEASIMRAIEKPPEEWDGLQDLFEHFCEHEQSVTQMINDISSTALEVKDHATYQFLMQYVDEQVEEEENSGELFGKIKFSQGKPEYIYSLDLELAARVYTQPFGTV